MGEAEEMEEERRLCYVAMTRAKEQLTMTNARQRMLFGRTTPCTPSRFLNEIPDKNMEWIGKPEPRRERFGWDDGWEQDGGFGLSDRGYGAEKRSSVPRKANTIGDSGFLRASEPAKLMYLEAGDGVRHDAFGTGMVISVRPMGGDALVEVAFDQVGTKKLMLKAAGKHLTKL
jgi:DNA helicase-2/ATP-dependent DNA helicase PcrA